MARYQEVNFKFQTWYLEFLLLASRSPSGAPSTSAGIPIPTPASAWRHAISLNTSLAYRVPTQICKAFKHSQGSLADAGVGIGMPALVKGSLKAYSRYQV